MSGDQDSKSADSINNTRRRVLQTIGGGMAVGLAGCSGDGGGTTADGSSDGSDGSSDGSDGSSDGSGGNNEGGTDSSEMTNHVLTAYCKDVPTDVHWNPYNPNGLATNTLRRPFFDNTLRQNYETLEWVSGLLSDWSIDNDNLEATLTVNEDHTWSNGDQVNGEDIRTNFLLGGLIDGEALPQNTDTGIWGYIDEITTEGKTAVFKLTDPISSDVVYPLLQTELLISRSEYNDYVERIDSASSDNAAQGIIQDLTEFRRDDPLTNGPLKMVDKSQTQVTTEVHDGHPNTEDLNFSEGVLKVYQENSIIFQAFQNGEIDQTTQGLLSESDEQTFLDQGGWYTDFNNFRGYSINTDLEHDIWGDRDVRKALRYTVDSERYAQISSRLYRADDQLNGLPLGAGEQALGSAAQEFTSYSRNLEKAAEHMRAAGFSRNNGTWQDGSGNAVAPTVKVPAGHQDKVDIGRSWVSTLKEFGIDAELMALENATFFSNHFQPRDYEIILHVFAGSGTNWSYLNNGFTHNWFGPMYKARAEGGVEVPWPPGDASGSTQNVDVLGKLDELARGPSEDRKQELLTQLAWVFNQDLPYIPICHQYNREYIQADWHVPEGESRKILNRTLQWGLRTGELTAQPDDDPVTF